MFIYRLLPRTDKETRNLATSRIRFSAAPSVRAVADKKLTQAISPAKAWAIDCMALQAADVKVI